MAISEDSDSSSDWSDTASEMAYRAECMLLAKQEAEYYFRDDIVVEIEVLRNPNPCHVEWINAANNQDFSNITEDTAVGALGYFIRALIMTSRLLAKDDELPDTRDDWKDILDHWLESQGRAMAGLMGRNKHPQIHDALLDPTSPLVARVRKWMNTYEFDRYRDLQFDPRHVKPASEAPPMFAQPSLVQVTHQQLREHGIGLLPKPKPAIPSASPATSRVANVILTDIETVQMHRF